MDFFGIDIGSVNIKVIRLSKHHAGFRLEAAAIAPTPVGGIYSENEESVQKLAEAISKLRNDAKITTKNVVASLPEPEIFTRIVSLPKMSMSELETAIGYEAEQYIPLPLSEVNYSYRVAEIHADGKMDVLLVAAPLRLIEKYERVLQLAGLIPLALETELLSVSRCLVPEVNDQAIMLVDIGARTSDIAIVRNGSMIFTRSIGTAGGAFTRALTTNMQVDEMQAEQLKRSYGMLPDQADGAVATALEPVFQVIVSEIHRTISFFSSRVGTQISHIKMTGGTSQMPHLAFKLAESLNIEVEIGNILGNVDDGGRASQIQGLPLYAAACGLAMKEL